MQGKEKRGLLEKWVFQRGGSRPIHRLLVANNGLAAVKEIRSIRRWCYATFGQERLVTIVAMASEDDLTANAEFIRMADECVAVPAGPNTHNYANVRVIVDVAVRARVQAVWAGWGHASENPVLSEELERRGIVFVGPTAGAMRALGDKISSMIVAQTASVPCLAWSGTGLVASPDSDGRIEALPAELYSQAGVSSPEEGLRAAERIGYPLMIKASEGGGGKGIRRVNVPTDFASSFDLVSREVPGSPIFLMRLASAARHLEVQILADAHGQAVALRGRDCSVQRRHQKIIEEAPVLAVSDPHQWRQMEEAAVRLAKMVGYRSAGTVEYLYDVEGQLYSFLELNPRLQVEHPCTEMITGVNLPAAQLMVAMGIPLHCIPDIRRLYGRTGPDADDGTSPIDFGQEEQLAVPVTGVEHVIACRLTAENPDVGFKPGGGQLHELFFRPSPSVWGYFSIAGAGSVHEYADSQFGHIFASGRSREEARSAMVMALKEASIRSEFRTTVEYLIQLLETSVFKQCTQTTAWLDNLIQVGFGRKRHSTNVVVAAAAAWKAHEVLTQRMVDAKALLAKGQMPSGDLLERSTPVQFIFEEHQFTLRVSQTGRDKYVLSMNDSQLEIKWRKLADGGMMLSMLGGRSFVTYGREEPVGLRLMINGETVLVERENDPTVVRTPSPGKLVRYLVEEGASVVAGTAIAEVEVMKMYMPLMATEAGLISPTRSPGTNLEAGDIVARIKLLDPTSIKLAKVYSEPFGPESCCSPVADPLLTSQAFQEGHQAILDILVHGYPSLMRPDQLIGPFLQQLLDPTLPISLFEDILSNVCGRLPSPLHGELQEAIGAARSDPLRVPVLLGECIASLQQWRQQCDPRDLPAIASVLDVLSPHLLGPRIFAERFLAAICDSVHESVAPFDGRLTNDAILGALRAAVAADLDRMFGLLCARHSGEARQVFFGSLLKEALGHLSAKLVEGDSPLLVALRRLGKLTDRANGRLSEVVKEVLIQVQLPSLVELKATMEAQFVAHQEASHETFIASMVSGLSYYLDVLPSLFLHNSAKVRALALEVYIRRVYEAFPFIETTRTEDTFCWVVAAPSPIYNRPFASHPSTSSDPYERRAGAFTAFASEAAARQGLKGLIERLSPADGTKNVLYFCLPDDGASDEQVLTAWNPFIKSNSALLAAHEIKRVTMIRVRESSATVGCYTFREMLDWREDCQVRHMEPAMSYLLELPRMLHHYDIHLCYADPTGQVHIYKGDPRNGAGGEPPRLFIRVLVRPMQAMRGHNTFLSLAQDARRIFNEVLDAVAMVQARQRSGPLDCNHLYIHVLPTFYAEPLPAAEMFLSLMGASAEKLLKLRVMQGEIRMQMARGRGETPEQYRFFLWNETGFVKRVSVYRQVYEHEHKRVVLRALPGAPGGDDGELDGIAIGTPHPPITRVQLKRNRAHALETSYVYDFPAIFERAIQMDWDRMGLRAPPQLCHFEELIVAQGGGGGGGEEGHLKVVQRPAGQNEIGMVAWRATLFTPAFPHGRQVIVIANDIEFQIGSFGVQEDILFAKASALARQMGWPRIYLSANSGARIGMAEELKHLVRVQWLDKDRPTQGLEYLYLEPEDYKTVRTSVRVEYVESRKHYRITDVLSGLGVENLSGSALIASETSRAYLETFTLTFVTGRSVGIGAYLVRLGQRVIQKRCQPIILTGVQALNQLLGKEVYANNLQIGGPQIMALNGVSHLVVDTDLEGVAEIVKWVEFVPDAGPQQALRTLRARTLGPLADDPSRPIAYQPPRDAPYDPRLLVTGLATEDGLFLGGLLDRGSFIEYQRDWARSVVVGRGRIGGLAVAVLLVETRTTQTSIPADPAAPSSESTLVTQAGQVWYPDSAFKTAQFLRDANYGERLPLIILANWRGFSGGQQDLFDEILKFGSYIVDALREYVPPVFVYLPPGAQLRGGSWVVVDTAINPRRIEMYADETARGGILEAEGLVAIKFRKQQLHTLLARLVPGSGGLAKESEEYHDLLTSIQQVACTFADLHDRPGRMKSLGIIRDIVPWREARRFFHHRLRVRLWEDQVEARAHHLLSSRPAMQTFLRPEECPVPQVKAALRDWLLALCIDPDGSDADLADALDRHAATIEGKLQVWCDEQTIVATQALLGSLGPKTKSKLVQMLLAEQGSSTHDGSGSDGGSGILPSR